MVDEPAVVREGVSEGTGGSRAVARSGPNLKVALFSVVLVGLVGILGFALVREATVPARSAGSRPALAAPRPALTPAEEAYARALWAIHNEVKAAALRMTFGGLNYKLGEIDRAELGTRVRAAREVCERAEARLRALQPTPSLQPVHAEYLEAVRLYQQSAATMARVLEDGRDDHLVEAFPMSQEAGRRLLRVGNVLWPSEYVPN